MHMQAKDVSVEENCKAIVDATLEKFGRLDILVLNAAIQHVVESVDQTDAERLLQTYKVNMYIRPLQPTFVHGCLPVAYCISDAVCSVVQYLFQILVSLRHMQ